CVPQKANGSSCLAANECTSGQCVDGFCCNSACGGQCQACDLATAPGTCSPINGTPHGARVKCDDGGGNICKAKACNGAMSVDACSFTATSGTPCGKSKCVSAVFTAEPTCDGMGTCNEVTPKACGQFSCDDKSCLTSCTSSDQCASGYECKSSS